MKVDITENTVETLGKYLQSRRLEGALDLEDVARETKLPLKTLRAIEADDYVLLPAPAFSRGFYGIYAGFLGLDQQEIQQRYDVEVLGQNKTKRKRFRRPRREEDLIGDMAARPKQGNAAPLFGLSLALIIVLAAFFCWYHAWNPATYFSEQLRSFQKSEGTESTPQQASSLIPQVPKDAVEYRYSLYIEFLEDTTVDVLVDGKTTDRGRYMKGSTHSWYATDTITLTLPDTAMVAISFNGAAIPLPPPQDGNITINFPR